MILAMSRRVVPALVVAITALLPACANTTKKNNNTAPAGAVYAPRPPSTSTTLPAGTATTLPNGQPASQPPATDSVLFVQEAGGGSFTPIPGKDNTFHLRLRDVDAHVLWFTDRPERNAGSTTTRTMLDGLGFAKGDVPPNAAIQVFGAKPDQDVRAVTLTNPSYNEAARTIEYDAVGLDKTAAGRLGRIADNADNAIPSQFGRAALFIDDAYNTCGVNLWNESSKGTLSVTNSSKWRTDTWTQQPSPGVAASGTGGPNETTWSTQSGFLRGCSNTVSYQYPDGFSATITATDPYSGANSYSCVVSDPNAGHCDLTTNGSTLGGDNLWVVYQLYH